MNILIQGIGLAAPRFSIDRQNALGFAKTMLHEPDRHTRGLEALYRMSAVHKRGSVLLEQEASGGALIELEQTFYPAPSARRSVVPALPKETRGSPSRRCRWPAARPWLPWTPPVSPPPTRRTWLS